MAGAVLRARRWQRPGRTGNRLRRADFQCSRGRVERVYFATLGSRVHALTPDGPRGWVWTMSASSWDSRGDRWSGADWVKGKGQVTWREQFCCVRDMALHGKTLVVPAGGAGGVAGGRG